MIFFYFSQLYLFIDFFKFTTLSSFLLSILVLKIYNIYIIYL